MLNHDYHMFYTNRGYTATTMMRANREGGSKDWISFWFANPKTNKNLGQGCDRVHDNKAVLESLWFLGDGVHGGVVLVHVCQDHDFSLYTITGAVSDVLSLYMMHYFYVRHCEIGFVKGVHESKFLQDFAVRPALLGFGSSLFQLCVLSYPCEPACWFRD